MTDHDRSQPGRTGSGGDEALAELQLQAALTDAYPALEVSPALRQRVAAILSHSPAQPPHSPSLRARLRSARLGWALAAAAMIVALLVPLLRPRWVAAQTLRRIQAAMDGVHTAHETHWQIAPNGARVRAVDTWYRDGQWRFVDRLRGQTEVFNHGKLWSYDRHMNRATVHQTSGPFGYNPSGFSLAARKRDFARWGWRCQIRVLGMTSAGGRSARQVAIQRSDEERELLLVDPATDLPIQSSFQRLANGRWVTEGETEYQFNQPLPAGLFLPDLPVAAKPCDWDAGREQWRRRLAPGLARRHIAGRLIVIRELWVNASGDVFLLYTAENPPPGFFEDWRAELTDDMGTHYHEAAGLDAYNVATHPVRVPGSNMWWGFSFDGQKLQGKWWVPTVSPHPWQPRQLTLTFYAAPDSQSRPATRPGDQSAGRRATVPRAAFHLRVERAGSTRVPLFMPYMFTLMDDAQIQRQEAEARAAAYRQVQDPMQSGDLQRGARSQADLLKALANYQQIVRMDQADARRMYTAPHDPGVWTNIGKVLYRLDRKQEARAAFERAIRESTENDWSRQEPQELLDGLNSILAWTPGRPAPQVGGTDLQGRVHSVADYRGRVLLVSIWSRFSPEFPQALRRLKALDRTYGPNGLAILGVAVDINRGALMQYVRAQQMPWPTLYDDLQYRSKVAGRFGYSWDFTRLPRTLLVDRQGIVRAVDLHGMALEKMVAELLAGK